MSVEKKHMKILYSIPTLDIGGAELLLLEICKAIKKTESSLELHVIVILGHGVLIDNFKSAGVSVHLLKNQKQSFILRFWDVFWTIKKLKPDVLHSHLYASDKFSLLAAFLLGIKKRLSTLHDMQARLSLSEKFAVYCVRLFANPAVAIANSVKDFWINTRRLHPNRVTMIYNAPYNVSEKTSAPKKYDAQKNSWHIISVGRLIESKGFIYLIRAMKLIIEKNPNTTLSIYGTDPLEYKKVLENEIEKLQLKKHISIVTDVHDLRRAYLDADLYVNTSLSEGFGMSLVEAMYAGLPCIVSDITAFREIITTNIFDTFVQPKDSDDLAAKTITLLANPPLLEQYSGMLQERAKHFNIESTAKKYTNLYFDYLTIGKI
ncbi:MAG: glycosyltransferase family 4 protein [Fibrobacteres bacterium]|nr:glycosyltransferase family 4 protein [Fibrobacterota bacterium]